MAEKWEYHTQFMYASADKHMDFLKNRFPGDDPSKFTPRALIPELNELGEQGWELVHMEPAYVGGKGDVLTTGDTNNHWTNGYFCAFKRRKA